METLIVTAPDSDVTVEVELDRLNQELCQQGIIDGARDEVPYFHLASLALECHNDDEYDVNRVLVEFIENNGTELDLSEDEMSGIKALLQ